MLKSIKWKIFFGFLVLAFMLFVAGGITIYEFISLNRTVNSLLENNYNTIQAAIGMQEAVKQEESGILLTLSGSKRLGTEMIRQGGIAFAKASLEAATHGIGTGNQKLIGDIRIKYDKFKSDLALTDLEQINDLRVSWYSGKLYPGINGLESSIQNLIIFNQDIIYSESDKLRDMSKRAIMPGIVAILSALIMAVIFTYFINKFFVKPILVLTKKVEDYKLTSGPIDAGIETQDELKQLETSIQDLIYRLRQK
jgi:methyl-accepting chemotaxis protein